MTPIRFKPYIGKNYHHQDLKILILGESHYLNENDFLDYKNEKERIELITHYVVNKYIEYKSNGKGFARWMNTFTKFGNVIHNKRMNNIETINFWEKCSFYNYVQFPTRKARVSPTNEEFLKSKNAFETVIQQTKPDLVIFWGQRLWNNFPKENYKKGEIETLKFNYSLPILVLPHPSSSKFNYSLFDRINDYIKLIKTQNN
mgnify:CR=1 FL=1